MRPGVQQRDRADRAWRVVGSLVAAVLAGSLLLWTSGPAAGQDDEVETPADPDDVTPLDSDAEQEGDGTDRLTWGVVPSGPDGPTGRARFDLDVAPGETLIDHLGVINYTFDEQTFDVYAQDAFTTDQGGFDILPAAETSTAAGTWVELDIEQVTVPPRSRVDLPFRVVVPRNATPGDHAAGIVASSTSAMVGEDGSRVAVDRRVGARVYLRVDGDLEPSLTIEQLEASYAHRLNPFGRSVVTFGYRVANTGNVRLAGDPTVATRWLFGWFSTSTAGEPLPELLPGESFTSTTELTGVAPLVWLYGDLEIVPVPAEGREALAVTPTVATVVVWALPWTLLALVLLVAGGLAYRRRRRRSSGAASAALSEGVRSRDADGDRLPGDRDRIVDPARAAAHRDEGRGS